MPDLDPRYAPYGSLALLTVESVSGASRMRNPAMAAIALANAAMSRKAHATAGAVEPMVPAAAPSVSYLQ
ncbi:MAG: hypothetical protein ACXWBL_13735 [Usitatibacter sp.]